MLDYTCAQPHARPNYVNMRAVMGVLRLLLAVLVVLFGAFWVFVFALLKVKRQGVPMALWVCTWAARVAMLPFNIRYTCVNPEAIRAHSGLILANHITLWDILMLLHVAPMRFMSNIGNKKIPVIGMIAEAIGTVWIDQKNRESRKAARHAVIDAPKFPPIVLFAEGGIGPAGVLRPFRYGAFEICRDAQTPYLPVAIHYSHGKAFEWLEKQPFHEVFWRIACTPGPIIGTVTALAPVLPAPDADIPALAAQAHRDIAGVLGVPPVM